MDVLELLRPYFSPAWMTALQSLPESIVSAVQEIRLRANAPIILSLPSEDLFLNVSSCSALHQNDALLCRQDELECCFLRFCEQSVYAHEEELRQGYIAVPGGIRVGVAGTAVCDGGDVRGVRQVTSLCIRLPRAHAGCARSLLPLIYTCDGVQNTLLVGEPSSGKTTLLRDVAASLSARRVRVAVVDEREEIAGVDGLPECDVLRGYPKAVGILQAVRCLAPQVVVFDELGAPRELEAVAACAHAGVAVIASLHGHSPLELQRKPSIHRLIEQEVFSQWIFLQGRYAPSVCRECLSPEVVENAVVWRGVDCRGRCGSGHVWGTSSISAG